MYTFTVSAETIEELQSKMREAVRRDETQPVIMTSRPEPEPVAPPAPEVKAPPAIPANKDYLKKPESTVVKHDTSEVDSRGYPWDKRIHASSHARCKDGTWRNARNVDKELLSTVEAELHSKYANVAPQAATTVEPVTTPLISKAPEPVPQAAPVATPSPFPTQGEVGLSHTLESFRANLPGIISTLVNTGRIDQSYINALKEFFGVSELWQAFNDLDKSEDMYENFAEAGLITKV